MTKEICRLSWEDGALIAATLGWMAAPGGMAFFHLYTVAIMVLVLSLGFNRGLLVGLSRTAGACVAILLFGFIGSMRHSMWMEILSLASCGGIAGALGDRQRRASDALKRSFVETLGALARALEARDPYTEGHSRRTSHYAAVVAREMGLDGNSRAAIEQAGLLHDLGKIGMPDGVLRKEGSLTPAEQVEMRRHPLIGEGILNGISFLKDAAGLVRHHHEDYDGSGYPDGLAGTAIPQGARIIAVADAFDAMTTDRPYRKALNFGDAIRQLEQGEKTQFDPAVVAAFKSSSDLAISLLKQ